MEAPEGATASLTRTLYPERTRKSSPPDNFPTPAGQGRGALGLTLDATGTMGEAAGGLLHHAALTGLQFSDCQTRRKRRTAGPISPRGGRKRGPRKAGRSCGGPQAPCPSKPHASPPLGEGTGGEGVSRPQSAATRGKPVTPAHGAQRDPRPRQCAHWRGLSPVCGAARAQRLGGPAHGPTMRGATAAEQRPQRHGSRAPIPREALAKPLTRGARLGRGAAAGLFSPVGAGAAGAAEGNAATPCRGARCNRPRIP